MKAMNTSGMYVENVSNRVWGCMRISGRVELEAWHVLSVAEDGM